MRRQTVLLIAGMAIAGAVPAACLLYVFRSPITASEPVNFSAIILPLVLLVVGYITGWLLQKRAGRYTTSSGSQSTSMDEPFWDGLPFVGMLLVNSAEKIEYANRFAGRLTGYTVGQLKGKTVSEVIPACTAPWLASSVGSASGATSAEDLLVKNSEGASHPVQLSAGTLSGLTCLMFLDLAEKNQYLTFRSKLISSLGHEVRTPLTSIQAAMKLLLSGQLGEVSAKAQEVSAVAEASALNLMNFVNEIADLQKLQEDRIQLSYKPVSVGGLVKKAVQDVSREADLRKVSVVVDHGCSDQAVLGDHARLEQVMRTLLAQTVRYTAKKGTVTISSKSGESKVCLTVMPDQGGLPEQLEAYLDSDLAWLEMEHGSIHKTGLAMAGQILRKHGSELKLSLTDSGARGLMFSLPACGTPADDRPLDEATVQFNGDRSKKHVLYLEDDAGLSRLVATMLEGDAAVHLAANVAQALSMLKEGTVNVLLSDMTLPDGAGHEVIQYARRNKRADYCVLYSAFEAEGALIDDYDYCFVKSRESAEEVVKTVRKLLNR